ncbi:hypothetical protein ACISON_07115, partial [Campylobacter jejuni]
MIRNFFIGMSFLGILFLAFYTLYDKKKESIFSCLLLTSVSPYQTYAA